MNTSIMRLWLVISLGLLAAVAPAPAHTARTGKTYAGIVLGVDPKERTLVMEGSMFDKEFNLSPACAYVFPGQTSGSIRDLRPGENVLISYREVAGVLVASRVEQRAMCFEGRVDYIDTTNHAITVYLHELDRTFSIARSCQIILLNGRTGVFTNFQIGDQVRVTYETPGESPMARRIEQTSHRFAGHLAAVDLSRRTVKAKDFFTTKQFAVAPGCAILIKGKPVALGDLKLNDKFVFRYDETNGTGVVNEIMPAAEATNSPEFDEYSIDL